MREAPPPKATRAGPDPKRAKEAGKSGETAKPVAGKSGTAASAAKSAKPKKQAPFRSNSNAVTPAAAE
jgi:hypothetical protein